MKVASVSLCAFRYLWAMPWSLVGLMTALVAILLGATARIGEGTLEVCGGRLGEWVTRLPFSLQLYAITFGHVIFGVDQASLSSCRSHERIHVRQYERWGILFVPLYCGSSILQLLRGRDPYRENHFEREAHSH